jgi:hypothetical protein
MLLGLGIYAILIIGILVFNAKCHKKHKSIKEN